MSVIEQLLEKKSSLFSIVVVGVIAVLAVPVILPHIFHTHHVLHIFLHVGGMSLAVFVTLLALLAYYRLKTKRLLLTFIAFANFIAAETVNLIASTWPNIYDIGDVSLLEVAHLLTFGTLALLAIGVFRND